MLEMSSGVAQPANQFARFDRCRVSCFAQDGAKTFARKTNFVLAIRLTLTTLAAVEWVPGIPADEM